MMEVLVLVNGLLIGVTIVQLQQLKSVEKATKRISKELEETLEKVQKTNRQAVEAMVAIDSRVIDMETKINMRSFK